MDRSLYAIRARRKNPWTRRRSWWSRLSWCSGNSLSWTPEMQSPSRWEESTPCVFAGGRCWVAGAVTGSGTSVDFAACSRVSWLCFSQFRTDPRDDASGQCTMDYSRIWRTRTADASAAATTTTVLLPPLTTPPPLLLLLLLLGYYYYHHHHYHHHYLYHYHYYYHYYYYSGFT